MGQDYNIYIHSSGFNGSNGISTKFQPFSDREPSESPSSAFKTTQQVISESQNFIGSGFQREINTGVAMLSKAFPIVAIIVAGLKITDKVLTTGFSHIEDYTGNYNYSINFNNFKTVVGNVVNPIKYLTYNWHRNNQFEKQNKQVEQQRTLFGNSILNRKIGV